MTTISQQSAVGSSVTRVDGVEKVTGSARYAYEYQVPDASYVWPVQATIARGRVTEVDTVAALAVPGVLAVLHSGNAPRLVPGVEPTHSVLQSPEVAYRGQVVAAVVATSLESAREGADAVGVGYERESHQVLLADVVAPRGSSGPLGPERFYTPGSVVDGSPGQFELGDADAALRTAPVVLDATYTTPAEHPSPMEPHATIASWDGDRLTLYNADQGPHGSVQRLVDLFGLEPGSVEIISEHIGGGFGSKAVPRVSAVLAALAARAIGRPVKIAVTRQQMFSLVPYRTPTVQRVQLGAERDGRLTVVDHDAVQQSSTLEEFCEQTVSSTRNMYATPSLRTTARLARLDVPPPSWFRAPGHTPGMFALESAMDELAERLDMDPIELRLRNEPEADPETGHPFSSRSLVECLREGAERFGWQPRRAQGTPGANEPRREGSWLIGTGMAAAHHPDYTFASTASARAEPDGTFVAGIAAADLGTGARTALTQVAADALDVPLQRVRVEIGRSSLGQAALAGGSAGTSSWSWAVDKACRALLSELNVRGGTVPEGGLEVRADTAEDLAAREPLARHSFGAQFAQVRVDTGTGEIRVDRMLGVFAAGRIINPRTARSQFLGSMTMGLSMALLEAGEIDPAYGDFANHDLAGYHIAAHADIPKLEVVCLDERDTRSSNPVGGKGVGELGIVGAAAAIANAFHHATGQRVRDLPIRVERSRAALRERRRAHAE
jgi:xanthine dehydrogenase YagR molybdenum-binding subunit